MQPYTVVIPVLNQLHYTQQCVQSLVDHGVPVRSLLVIDNGSTDGMSRRDASQAGVSSVLPLSMTSSDRTGTPWSTRLCTHCCV